MISIIESIINKIRPFRYTKEEANALYEMATIYQKESKLPMITWASPGQRYPHGPRLKVQPNHSHKIGGSIDSWASVTISDNPYLVEGKVKNKDLILAKRFILLNQKLLLTYWNEKITTGEFFKRLKYYSKETWRNFIKYNPQYKEY